jgi:hypothetical protein
MGGARDQWAGRGERRVGAQHVGYGESSIASGEEDAKEEGPEKERTL